MQYDARNGHMGLPIPYDMGIDHAYEHDFPRGGFNDSFDPDHPHSD